MLLLVDLYQTSKPVLLQMVALKVEVDLPHSHRPFPPIRRRRRRSQWRPSRRRRPTLSSSAMPASVPPRWSRRPFLRRITAVTPVTITTFQRSRGQMELLMASEMVEVLPMERPTFTPTILQQTLLLRPPPRPSRPASTTSTLRRSAITTSRIRPVGRWLTPSLIKLLMVVVLMVTPTITTITTMDLGEEEEEEVHRW